MVLFLSCRSPSGMCSDGPQPGFENFVRIFRVVLLFSYQGVADFFCASACYIISRLELFVNSFFTFFSKIYYIIANRKNVTEKEGFEPSRRMNDLHP